MSLIDDARQLAQHGIGMHCDACTGSPLSGHIYGCPMLAMPKILAALEHYDSMLHSMARVWNKAQGALEEGTDVRAEYKQYVELGDTLYHATGGDEGKCGQYGEPCAGDIEAVRKYLAALKGEEARA
jgi:hypothetical protein